MNKLPGPISLVSTTDIILARVRLMGDTNWANTVFDNNWDIIMAEHLMKIMDDQINNLLIGFSNAPFNWHRGDVATELTWYINQNSPDYSMASTIVALYDGYNTYSATNEIYNHPYPCEMKYKSKSRKIDFEKAWIYHYG